MTNKYIPIVFLFAAVLLIPGGAFASNNSLEDPNDANNYNDGNKLEPDFEELPNPMAEHIKTNETVLKQAHSDVTNYMIMANDSEINPEEYTGPEIPFTMVYIDDDRLVVGLDPLLAHLDYTIEPEIIQEILGIDLPVEVQYVSLENELSSSRENRIIKQYQRDCMPVMPTKTNPCKRLDTLIERHDIQIPGRGSSTDNTPGVSNFKAKLSGDNIKLTWDATNTSKIKYYKVFASENYNSYKYKGKISKYSESYTASSLNDGKTYMFKIYMYYTDGNKTKVKTFVSNTVKTPVPEPYVVPTLKNIKAKKSGDDIKLTWSTTEQSKIKYYKIYKYADGRYAGQTTLTKTSTSYTLSDADDGKEHKFKIYLYYKNQNNKTSTNIYWSNPVDIPRVIPVDTTSPVITVPSNITTISTESSGKTVTYTVSGRDNLDPRVPVICTPASGSNFDVGTTRVTCKSTDAAGNRATERFTVTVTYEAPVVQPPVVQPPVVQPPVVQPPVVQPPVVQPPVVQPPVITPQPEIMDFYGGDQHRMHLINATGDNVAGRGTITIGATTTNGTVGMVTAGHTLDLEEGEILRHYSLGEERQRIADTTPRVIIAGNVDAAFTPILDDNIVVHNQIETRNGDVIDIKQGLLSRINPGQELMIYGIHNEGTGDLLFKNVTTLAEYAGPSGIVLTNMGIATYPSQKGDSGAPIVYHTSNNAYIVGSNRGTLCYFDTFTTSQPLVRSEDSGGSCRHNDDGTRHYKIFSSWENIKSALDLQ